jgi:hypothetical protein
MDVLTGPLTDAQVAQYATEGYLHLPGVFSAAQCDVLDAAVETVLAEGVARESAWDGTWRATYGDATDFSVQTVRGLHLRSNAWWDATHDPPLVEIVSQLLQAPATMLTATLISKPPKTGGPFPLHQDGVYYGRRKPYVIATIALDATTPDNGSLRILPGSHVHGELRHEGDNKKHLALETYQLADTVLVPAQRGDVVCLTLWTVHGSEPNRSDRVRRTVRVGYGPPGATHGD